MILGPLVGVLSMNIHFFKKLLKIFFLVVKIFFFVVLVDPLKRVFLMYFFFVGELVMLRKLPNWDIPLGGGGGISVLGCCAGGVSGLGCVRYRFLVSKT